VSERQHNQVAGTASSHMPIVCSAHWESPGFMGIGRLIFFKQAR
jgi:hypothetical protein